MSRHHPPKRALRFLRWFCREDYLEEIEGNLIEIFNKQAKESTQKANRNFFWQVFLHFRPDFIKSFRFHPIINTGMWKNYFKVAWRNMLREKLYSFINLAGLTIGLTCFILIALFIQYEFSFDTHHEKADRIYRIYQQLKGNTYQGSDLFAGSPQPLAPAMMEAFPEVEAATNIVNKYDLLSFEDKAFSPRVLYADKYVFDVFTIPIVEGIGAEALEDPNTILMSVSLAKKFFGEEPPIGKAILFDNDRPFTVKGIFEDIPDNQHIVYEFIISIENYTHYKDDIGRWASNNYSTYAVLQEGYAPKQLEQKMSIFDEYVEAAYQDSPYKAEYFLKPIRDIHFTTDVNFMSGANSDIRYIYLFGSIGLIILLLAAINYMNLATARSISRSKEVGMRKVLGARKHQLVVQLLGESFLLTMLSFLLALALVYALLPFFNALLDQSIPFGIIGSRWLLIGMFLFAFCIGGLSGLYPALFLSTISPIKAFKGNFLKKFGKGTSLRNVLIVGQFTAAIILTISSVVVHQQLQFIKNKKLGYNRDQVVYVPFWFKKINDNYAVIRNELLQHPEIDKVSLSVNLPTNTNNQGIVTDWEGNSGNENFSCYRYFVDYHFLDLYEMELLLGRNFSPDHPTDSSSSYLLNESAVKAIGWTPETAIGKGFRGGKVIGVLKDFHFQPMNLNIEPLFMVFRSEANTNINQGNISMKVKTDNLENTIAHIRQTFKRVAPDIPFYYHFLDESYNNLYATEHRIGKAFNIFTLLALFIACVGLFGLVSFSVTQRTKEIGIRKVLGASIFSIIQLLSKDFLRLVGIALLIAIPIAWYFMQEWLNDFVYHINIQWHVFIFTALTTLSISLITVGLQSIKAAVANPIESLKNED